MKIEEFSHKENLLEECVFTEIVSLRKNRELSSFVDRVELLGGYPCLAGLFVINLLVICFIKD